MQKSKDAKATWLVQMAMVETAGCHLQLHNLQVEVRQSSFPTIWTQAGSLTLVYGNGQI